VKQWIKRTQNAPRELASFREFEAIVIESNVHSRREDGIQEEKKAWREARGPLRGERRGLPNRQHTGTLETYIQGTNTTREIEERERHRQMPTQDSERNTSALVLRFHSDRNICHLPPKILNLETSNWLSHPIGRQTDASVRQ
jgi:hypothetical protein